MSDLDVAAQYLKITFEGTEIAFRIARESVASSVAVIQKMIKMFAWMHNKKVYGKEIGGTNIKNLLTRDSNILACEIPQMSISDFNKMAKKLGVLYTKIPDFNNDKLYYRVMFRASDYPQVQQILNEINKKNRFKFSEKKINKLISKTEKKNEKVNDAALTERLSLYKEILEKGMTASPIQLTDYINNIPDEKFNEVIPEDEVLAESKNVEKKINVITDNTHIVEENEKAVKIAVPDKINEHIWVSRKNINESADESISFTLEPDKTYKTYAANNKVNSSMVAEEIAEYFKKSNTKTVYMDNNELENVISSERELKELLSKDTIETMDIDSTRFLPLDDKEKQDKYLISIDEMSAVLVDKKEVFDSIKGTGEYKICIDKNKEYPVMRCSEKKGYEIKKVYSGSDILKMNEAVIRNKAKKVEEDISKLKEKVVDISKYMNKSERV